MDFFAESVNMQLEEDYWLLGFADSQFETTNYFMLQRAFEFNEQDSELGMDTYYFEFGDQACSSYGGIERFKLQRNSVRISLEPQKAESLEIEKVLEIQFKLEQDTWNELKTFLENIFANTNVLELKT